MLLHIVFIKIEKGKFVKNIKKMRIILMGMVVVTVSCVLISKIHGASIPSQMDESNKPINIADTNCWEKKEEVHIRDKDIAVMFDVPVDINVTIAPAEQIQSLVITLRTFKESQNIKNFKVIVFSNQQEYILDDILFTVEPLSNEDINIVFNNNELTQFIADKQLEGELKFMVDFVFSPKNVGTTHISMGSTVNGGACPLFNTVVSPMPPTLSDYDCEGKPNVIAEMEGVDYLIQEIEKGYSIKAVPQNGFEFEDNSTTEWMLDYETTVCPLDSSPSERPSKPQVGPATGDSTHLTTVTTLFISAGLTILFILRKRKQHQ